MQVGSLGLAGSELISEMRPGISLPSIWKPEYATFPPLATVGWSSVGDYLLIKGNREVMGQALGRIREYLWAPYDMTSVGVQAKISEGDALFREVIDTFQRFRLPFMAGVNMGDLDLAWGWRTALGHALMALNAQEAYLDKFGVEPELEPINGNGGFDFAALIEPPGLYFVLGGVALFLFAKK